MSWFKSCLCCVHQDSGGSGGGGGGDDGAKAKIIPDHKDKMSAAKVVSRADLEADVDPEEIENVDAAILSKKVTDVEANFGSNFGFRHRRQRIIGSSNDPVVTDGKLGNQDFEELRSESLDSGELFVDPQFPPDGQSLYFSRDPPYDFEWKRASEVCEDAKMFDDGASRFDIIQGELGDCWLLAALANLTLNKKLLYRVVPKDQSFTEDYAGIFHFRFWQYGEWVDVVVDDFLPTRDGRLVFMHSQSDSEFWTALLEKAYAKLHGSYEALKGGTTCEAMVDFTGGCSEVYDLNEEEKEDGDASIDLFSVIKKAHDRKSMKGCSMEPQPGVVEAKTDVGLIRGHAYSITKVVRAQIETPSASGQIPLLRIRNPWGNEAEWVGPWSDASPEWQFIPDEEKEAIGLTFDDDGEFWMSFKDFKHYFDQLEICNLTPDSYEDGDDDDCDKWEVAKYEGSWVQGETAGGCRNFLNSFPTNPQFRINVVDPDDDEDDLCTVIVSVMQKGRRAMRDEGLDTLTIGFTLYHIRDTAEASDPLDQDFFRYNRSVGTSKAFVNLREVTSRFRLPPGCYCIIPSTFNPEEEGDFILRIISEKAIA